MNATRVLLSACTVLIVLSEVAGGVEIATVVVGNPCNPSYYRFATVPYVYRMGTYEVTAGQYAAFLNAVARTDTYDLYNPNMDAGVDPLGCNIKRSGEPGQYSYSIASDWANRPVNYVSSGDVARFTNWMHNGQPTTGVQDATTTEDGSYPLYGAPSDAWLPARKPEATWVIPTSQEWSKAAFHKNDGVSDNYWYYPTSSDNLPSNTLVEPVDSGNNATFKSDSGDYTIGAPYWRTEVGAHENSVSAYGTFDQAGNVREWTQTKGGPYVATKYGTSGGSFNDALWPAEPLVDWVNPWAETAELGFRLAYVPEPGTLAGLVLGATLLVRSRRRPGRVPTFVLQNG